VIDLGKPVETDPAIQPLSGLHVVGGVEHNGRTAVRSRSIDAPTGQRFSDAGTLGSWIDRKDTEASAVDQLHVGLPDLTRIVVVVSECADDGSVDLGDDDLRRLGTGRHIAQLPSVPPELAGPEERQIRVVGQLANVFVLVWSGFTDLDHRTRPLSPVSVSSR